MAPNRRCRASARAALLLFTASCGGRVVPLGAVSSAAYHFGPAVRVPELASTYRRENPTLTDDLLEIYFTSNEDSEGNGDVWFAERSRRGDPFGTPAPVTAVNSTSYETSSGISSDGLSLWFGSNRAGGVGGIDIWVAERPDRRAAWSAPVNLADVNTSADEIPRPPGQHGLVMPMASTKNTPVSQGDRVYQSYFSKRSRSDSPFQAPVDIPGLVPGPPIVDGCLSDDGLTLFFSASADAFGAGSAGAQDAASPLDGGTVKADIFVAFRSSVDQPFAFTQALSDLDTDADERDPWISPDGSVFYFTSDRDGTTGIYSAVVVSR